MPSIPAHIPAQNVDPRRNALVIAARRVVDTADEHYPTLPDDLNEAVNALAEVITRPVGRPARMNTQPGEIVTKAREMAKEGNSPAKIARELELPYSTVYGWIKTVREAES